MKTLEKVHCHSGTGCQLNRQIPPFLIKRQGQSTFEALLILAAAAVLLLGLLVFAGNEGSGTATIFGRTRELVCQLIEGGNGSKARSGTTADASLSEDDQPLRIPHRPSPSVNRSPQASSERVGDARSMESDRSPLASKPSPTPTYATTPVPTAMPKPPSNTRESSGRTPAPYPTPPAAPAPAPTKTPQTTSNASSSPSPQRADPPVPATALTRDAAPARSSTAESPSENDAKITEGIELTDTLTDIAKDVFEDVVDHLADEENVDRILDRSLIDAINKDPNLSEAERQKLLTIARTARKRSGLKTLITTSAKILRHAPDFYHVYEREQIIQQIHEYNRNGDLYNAYRTTVDALLDELPVDLDILEPYVSEIIVEATVDVYAQTGNRVAWYLWESGFIPHPPRYPKDHFDKGVERKSDS